MFGKKIHLFTLLGFAVNIDLSWLLLAVLITWSLAVGLFPSMLPGLASDTYWLMGIVGALGFFLSVVLHEVAHSLVARRHGIPMRGITLFVFGGVAEMNAEPPNPRSELLMAIAGPAASLLIAGFFFALTALGRLLTLPPEGATVGSYLAFINLILAGFNLIPAFPLDGGRVLRSVLWQLRGDLGWATRISSTIGSGFGGAMIVLGLIMVLTGGLMHGLWWFLLGMFLFGAARGSYRQLIIRRTFEGVPVRELMRTDPVTVPRSISVAALVEHFVYRYHYKMFPVMDGAHLWGCVTTRDIARLPRGEWARQTVSAIATPHSQVTTIHPDEDALRALATMGRTGSSRLMVVDGEELVGVVALRDLLDVLSLKRELEPSPATGVGGAR